MSEASMPSLPFSSAILSRFQYHPEYMRVGETLLFREGRAKGVGRIRALMGAHGSGASAGDPVGALPVRPAVSLVSTGDGGASSTAPAIVCVMDFSGNAVVGPDSVSCNPRVDIPSSSDSLGVSVAGKLP